jgi:hypothetical protein
MAIRSFLLLICTALIVTPVLAHDGAHVLGTVTKVSQDRLTVEQRNKSVAEVAILPTTTFTRDTAPAKLADVKVGDRVAINAVEKAGKLVAESVRFISAKAQASSAAAPKPAAR